MDPTIPPSDYPHYNDSQVNGHYKGGSQVYPAADYR